MSPEDFRAKLKKKKAAMQAAHISGLQAIGMICSTTVKNKVQKSPRGGKTYKIYTGNGNFRLHKASAAGEAPATDLGSLARSVTYRIHESQSMVVILCSLALAPYAIVLEYGNSSGTLQARPFMRPGVAEAKKKAMATYESIMSKVSNE